MPIYEYACTHCGHSFDELQKVSEAALVHCPKCDEPSLRKLLSAPRFRLKGKGWYETDFKTGDKRNLAGDSEAKPASKDDKQSSDKKSPGKKPSDQKSDNKSVTPEA